MTNKHKPAKKKVNANTDHISKAFTLSNFMGHLKKNWVEVKTFVKKTSIIEPKSLGL